MKTTVAQPTAQPWTEVVECPQCDESLLHLGPVAVTQAADTIEVGYSRHDRVPKLAHEFNPRVTVRGSRVTLRFMGECGHNARLVFQFHKGAVYVWWEQDLSSDPSSDDSPLWCDQLWRD